MKEIVGFVDSPAPGHQAIANMFVDYGDVLMHDANPTSSSTPVSNSAPPTVPAVTDTAMREAARQSGFSAKRKRPADGDEEEDQLFEKRQKDTETTSGIKRLVGVEASASGSTGEVDYKALVKKLASRLDRVAKTGSDYYVEDMPKFDEIGKVKKIKKEEEE
jgi:hypothetical protein